MGRRVVCCACCTMPIPPENWYTSIHPPSLNHEFMHTQVKVRSSRTNKQQ